jgi:hypothetical protein
MNDMLQGLFGGAQEVEPEPKPQSPAATIEPPSEPKVNFREERLRIINDRSLSPQERLKATLALLRSRVSA